MENMIVKITDSENFTNPVVNEKNLFKDPDYPVFNDKGEKEV